MSVTMSQNPRCQPKIFSLILYTTEKSRKDPYLRGLNQQMFGNIFFGKMTQMID